VKLIKLIFVAIVSVIFIVFCVFNREIITVSLFPFSYSVNIPIFLLVLLSMAVGVVIASFILNIKLFRMKHLVKNTKQRMQAVENENKSFRSEREFSLPTNQHNPA
jgi:uncharacterized integral membrane protein